MNSNIVSQLKPPFIIVPRHEGKPEFRMTFNGIVNHYESNDLVEYDFYDSAFNQLIFEAIGNSANFALKKIVEPTESSQMKASILGSLKKHFPTQRVDELNFAQAMHDLAVKFAPDKS